MTEKEIVAKACDISLEKSAATATLAENNFCSVWPAAKQGLTLLQGIVKNPIAKADIGIVIAAGDAVASQYVSSKPKEVHC